MPPTLDGTEDVSSTSSETEALDAKTQASPDGGETAPESSPGADAKEAVSEKDWDPLSVVKAAVEGKQKDSDGDGEGQNQQPDKSSKSENDSQKTEGAEEPLGEITAEELKSYKPTTRKRIEALLDDRSRLTERLEEAQPAVEQMESLRNFMQEKNLSTENVSELMVVGGLAMSDDPKDLRAALNRVNQFKAQIESQLGDILPDDLQKKVEDGHLDAEAAKEVALSRIATARAENKVKGAETVVQTTQNDSQKQVESAAAQVVHSTISDWQREKASKDPDYPRKAELLQKEIRLRVMAEGGKVLDKNKALKIADDAYAEVNRLYKALAPAQSPQAKRFTQSKSAPGNMATKPNSPLEAARAGLSKGK